jgi:hypothetical protein
MIEFILGDLREEYGLMYEERGAGRARVWYLRQLLLSVPAMVKPFEMVRPLAVAVPLLLLDRLWCLVYSLIPLKDGLDRAPGLLAINIVCGCLCASAARVAPLPAAVSAGFALAFSISSEPPLYICLTLAAVPLAACLRRIYEVA